MVLTKRIAASGDENRHSRPHHLAQDADSLVEVGKLQSFATFGVTVLKLQRREWTLGTYELHGPLDLWDGPFYF